MPASVVEVVVVAPLQVQFTTVTATVALAGEKSGRDWSVITTGKSPGTGWGRPVGVKRHLATSVGPVKPPALMNAEDSLRSASMSLNAAKSPASLVQSTAAAVPSKPPAAPE